MIEMNPVGQQNPQAARKSGGCVELVLSVMGGLIVLVTSIVALITGYSLDQLVFEGSLDVGFERWQVALFFALGLIVVVGVLYAIGKNTGGKAALRAWLLAAVFALLIVPARLAGVTQAQWVGAAQIAGMLVFLAGMRLANRARPPAEVVRDGSIWAALLCGLVLAIPWVLWGALGSPVDVVLNLLTGLLFGVSAALLLRGILQDEAVQTRWRVGTVGFVFALVLLVMVAGLAQNNQQLILGLTMPVLSRAAVTLMQSGRGMLRKIWPSALLLGLAASWPLMWVDSDELALVIGAGNGELTYWVRSMLTVMIGLILLVTLLLPVLTARLARDRRVILAGLAVLAFAGLAVVYFIPGQPGFHGERLFVIFKDQADVSAVANIADYNARRVMAYDMLTNHADQTQTAIRGRLEQLKIAYRPYYLVNALEVDGGPLLRLWLENRDEVDRVLPNPILRPLPEPIPAARGASSAPDSPQWNLTMIGADRVWSEFGVTGKGVIVGQSDSGAQGDHPELADSYRGSQNGDNYNWFDPWFGSSSPVDIGGHGTHTLGSVLGNKTGVAPDATWIGCVNLGRNLGNPALYLDCMQFMLAPFPQDGDPFKDGDPVRGAMVLNNSWGCPDVEGCDASSLQPAVRALRDAGVFVVVSAGNGGYSGCATVSDPPAIYAEVYTVGAVNSNGELAGFSSLGPVEVDGSGRIKPDIAAPGDGVLSAYPNSSYEIASGTSMAGPHVVGVVALMWSANPALIGDIEATTRILNETAHIYGSSQVPTCGVEEGLKNNGVGNGLVDAYEAVKAARAYTP